MAGSAELSQPEKEELDTLMLRAALKQLGELPADTDDEDSDDMAIRVIHALTAVEDVRNEFLRKAQEQLVEELDYVFGGTQSSHAVGTAFFLWISGMVNDIDGQPAYSVASNRLLGFAQGIAAAFAMENARYLLEEGMCFRHSVDGAKALSRYLDESP